MSRRGGGKQLVEHKPKGGAGSCKGSQVPQLAGYLAKETQDVTLMGS